MGEFLSKTLSGDMCYDERDAVGVGRGISKLVPYGDTIDLPFAGIEAGWEAADERKELSQALGGRLSQLANRSKGVKRKIKQLDEKVTHAVATAGAGAVGGTTGMMVGSALIPIPIVGTLGGMWIGGTVAEKLYSEAAKTQEQDAVTLAAEIRLAQKQGEKIPPEVVFATIAANMPGRTGKRLEDRLQKLTGTRDFSTAVSEGKNKALQQMMREYDLDVRAYTGIPIDTKDPRKSASRQYADLINSHKLDARALIFDPWSMPSIVRATQQPKSRTSQTATARVPIGQQDLRSVAGNLRNMGVTVASADAQQLLPSGKTTLSRA